MAATPVVRATAPSGTAQAGSSKVATGTMAAMVFGVLCLFGLVLTYQLVPRLHRRTPAAQARLAAAARPPADRGNRLTRPIRRLLSRLSTLLSPSTPKTDAGAAPHAAQTHPSLRPLHLQSVNSVPRTPRARRKPRTPLRLNIPHPRLSDLLVTPSPTPTPSRKHFRPLDDSLYPDPDPAGNAMYLTEKPPPARMSPWSPREADFPYPATPAPTQWRGPGLGGGWEVFEPPPPFSPPPAYVPGTPRRWGWVGQPSPPVSPGIIKNVAPIEQGARAEKKIDLSEIVVCNHQASDVDAAREAAASAFVIADDDDVLSDTASVSSTWSSGTNMNAL